MPYFDGSRGSVYHDSLPGWQPPEARAAVVLLHGHGEHLGLYDALGRRLAADGFAVHSFDQAGHGRSSGDRAVIHSWDDIVADALRLTEHVSSRHPGLPLAVVGHSGGGLAAALLTLRHPSLFRAAVLSGAPVNRLEWVAGEVAAGTEETESGEPTEWVSTHPEYVHALLHDPLTWKGGFKRATLAALLPAWDEVEAGFAAGRPDLPVLFVHGAADPVVPVAGIEATAERLPKARLVAFAGDLHDVMNEHDRDVVHDAVADFLSETLVREPVS